MEVEVLGKPTHRSRMQERIRERVGRGQIERAPKRLLDRETRQLPSNDSLRRWSVVLEMIRYGERGAPPVMERQADATSSHR